MKFFGGRRVGFILDFFLLMSLFRLFCYKTREVFGRLLLHSTFVHRLLVRLLFFCSTRARVFFKSYFPFLVDFVVVIIIPYISSIRFYIPFSVFRRLSSSSPPPF